LGIGFALVGASLALPWIGLVFSTSPSAFTVHLLLAGLPGLGHLSYGLLLVGLWLIGSVAALGNRCLPNTVTRCVGIGVVVLVVVFVVSTRLGDYSQLAALDNDAALGALLHAQTLTANVPRAPSTFFGFQLDGGTTELIDALRLGWYLAFIGGLFLLGRPRPRSRRGRLALAALGGAVALVVVIGVVVELVAQRDEQSGVAALAAGAPHTALADLSRALSLNPALGYDEQLDYSYGAADVDLGYPSGLATFARAMGLESIGSATRTTAQLTLWFEQALRQLRANPPADLIARRQFDDLLIETTLTARQPILIDAAESEDNNPLVAYTLAHYYYETGDGPPTVELMERAYHETTNGELRSLCLTYAALGLEEEGKIAQFRTTIVDAVEEDAQNQNVLAREIASGLFIPNAP
jgi:hypothetical protein